MSSIIRWHMMGLISQVNARRRRVSESRRRRRARALLRKTFDPFRELSATEFIKTFRIGKDTVRNLAEELTPHMPRERRNDGITTLLKILITLAFYASGSYQTLVGQSSLHSVSQTTVSRAVRQVTEALNTIYPKYVKWPTTREERNGIKTKFYEKFGIPGILGCIDGTHIAIIRPHIHEERYFNRKGFHSLNVMIICDSDLNILCVDPSSPGSAHDSNVWRSHPLSSHLIELSSNGEQVFLLGDSGYPLRNTMITPILNTLEGTPEHNFYAMHVTARNTVERCIGVLKARFRCLLAARALHYDPVRAGKIVNACCVLHNIANNAQTAVPLLTPEETNAENLRQQQLEEDFRAEAGSSQNDRNRRVNPDLLAGRALQQTLVNRLWRDRMN